MKFVKSYKRCATKLNKNGSCPGNRKITVKGYWRSAKNNVSVPCECTILTDKLTDVPAVKLITEGISLEDFKDFFDKKDWCFAEGDFRPDANGVRLEGITDFAFTREPNCNLIMFLNHQNKYGQTLLHHAAFKRDKGYYDYLVSLGANPNIIDNNRMTAKDIKERFKCC
jgi:hypothetical protein